MARKKEKNMIIEGHDVNIFQISPIDWQISIRSPSDLVFVSNVKAQAINETAALEFFKKNKNQFIINMDSGNFQISKKEESPPNIQS